MDEKLQRWGAGTLDGGPNGAPALGASGIPNTPVCDRGGYTNRVDHRRHGRTSPRLAAGKRRSDPVAP